MKSPVTALPGAKMGGVVSMEFEGQIKRVDICTIDLDVDVFTFTDKGGL